MRWINYSQMPSERREKYWLVISCGGSYYDAQKMRDWRLSKIERFFGLLETYNPHTKKYDRQLNIPHSVSLSTASEPGIEATDQLRR